MHTFNRVGGGRYEQKRTKSTCGEKNASVEKHLKTAPVEHQFEMPAQRQELNQKRCTVQEEA